MNVALPLKTNASCLMSVRTTSDEPVSRFPLTAVVIYDDLALGEKAHSVLERAVRQAGETTDWAVKTWRVEELRQSETEQDALAQAAEAHLILLALRCFEFLPAWTWGWLHHWAAQRRISDAAVAVLDGLSGCTHGQSAPHQLFEFTRCHGLTLICHQDTSAKLRLSRCRTHETSANSN